MLDLSSGAAAAPVRLLAVDTSTEQMAIAVSGPRGVSRCNAAGGAQASANLLPAVKALIDQAGLRLGDLDGVAFGRGPGAFTGLRTASAVAQGLGLGLGRPLLSVDSLMIVAEDAWVQGPLLSPGGAADVGVAMDARMGELYAARYRLDGGRWSVLCEPVLCAPEALLAHWRGVPPLLAGSGLAMLEASVRERAQVCRPVEQDRAAALMRVALQLWPQSGAVPPEQGLPLYLRERVALTSEERLHLSSRPSKAAA